MLYKAGFTVYKEVKLRLSNIATMSSMCDLIPASKAYVFLLYYYILKCLGAVGLQLHYFFKFSKYIDFIHQKQSMPKSLM